MKLLAIVYSMLKQRKWSLFLLMGEIIISSLLFVSMAGELVALWKSAGIVNVFQNTNSYYFTPFTYYSPEFKIENYLTEDEKAGARIAEIHDIVFKLESGEICSAIAYDSVMISNILVDIESGRWFSKEDEEDEKLVAIAVGDFYEVGDVLQLENDMEVRIIGTVSKSAYIVRMMNSSSSGNASLAALVSQAFVADFIFLYETDNAFENVICESSCLIEVNDLTVENDILLNLEQFGDITSISQMKENYMRDTRDYFIINGILLCIFSFLTIVGILGNNGIWYIKNQKKYVVYYMLGLSNRKCKVLEALETSFVIGVSYMIFAILYVLFFREYLMLKDSGLEGLLFLLLLFYFAIIYVITSYIFIKKTGHIDIIELYKRGNE